MTTADKLRPAPVSERSPFSSSLDDQLGPFKFAGEGVDIVEVRFAGFSLACLGPSHPTRRSLQIVQDNTFVFVDKAVPVPKRRKHFADPANRRNFTYSPDVVYATCPSYPLHPCSLIAATDRDRATLVSASFLHFVRRPQHV